MTFRAAADTLGRVLRRLNRRSALRLRRLLGAGLALLALLAALGAPVAAALTLSIRDARAKSEAFAKRTCARDEKCVRHGVLNCRRQSPHVVLCRIFDERRTDVQGRYTCHRLIRVAVDARSHRIRVTGLGRWHC